ncbi:MAG TPA: thiamine pyrophosphate-binding protein [Chloroflexota bacterium]|nr:thiamine pyrophosphate-binding protein [Chloroflexota bacterium]
MRVYEAVGETLKQLGVDVLFGLLGGANLQLVTYWQTVLRRPYYAARHEGSAVAMADGYARVSGRVGVATVTEGPGVTNTLTALTEAVKASSPLLLIAGDTPTRLLYHPQAIDQAAVCSAVGAAVQPVHGPDMIVFDLVRAYQRALLEQRPVVLSLPTELQTEACAAEALTAVSVPCRQAVRPTDEVIARLADLVQAAQRPVILGGRGAARAAAREPLVRLADRIGALLATTGQAKGLFAGHPYYIGSSGVFASPLGAQLLGQADLLLAFGASLNHYTTRNRELYARSARFVQVDIRAAALGALTPIDLGVVGDAAATAEALDAELERRGFTSTGFRSAALEQAIAQDRAPGEFVDQSNGQTIDPRTLMLALEQWLPRDRTVVLDSGHSMGWPTVYLTVPDATAFVFANDFMVVGLGQAMAFGAAIARPERLTVAVIGDGGMMMSLGELDTIVRYQVPLLIVVMNDAAYGIEVHLLARAGQPIEPALFPDRDFAAIARAVGAQGFTVRDLEDLAPLHDWLREPVGPLVLDCKLDPRLRADWLSATLAPDSWYARLMRHGAAASGR